MDTITDVLNAQRGTSALTPYQGNSPVTADPANNKLAQLISALESMLSDLPPDIAAMMSGVIQDAEELLSAGGTPQEIQEMIERLQQIIQALEELMAQLQSATGGGVDLSQLQSLLTDLSSQLDPSQRSALIMTLQKLRKLAVGNSLKGVDEVNLGSIDGTSQVEPITSNVIQSLQQLIQLAMTVRPQVTPTNSVQTASLQTGGFIPPAALG